MRLVLALLVLLLSVTGPVLADPLDRDGLAALILPPYALGEPLGEDGVHALLNSGGAEAGYVFQTEPLAPLPGFSGAPINLLVLLDLDGRFIDVRLIEHNEPIFVSGLGQAPFHKFVEQYQGLSINQPMVVGTPYGHGATGSGVTYLDGVTKATASVRIAHESIMGAALAVAREKMQGIAKGPTGFPDPDHSEPLTWADLVAQGLATHKVVTNARIDAEFAGTIWAEDDPEAQADPDAPYLDLWVVDLGPASIARAALSDAGYDELRGFLSIFPDEEPILVIETARHGLVSPDFVRNTAPDWLQAEQDGLPVALRDSDLLVELASGVPEGVAMILRTDRRLGFDPSRDWVLKVAAVREHGMFQPQIGTVTLDVPHRTAARFFTHPKAPAAPAPPWLTALRDRATDLIALSLMLTGLCAILLLRMNRLAGLRAFPAIRLTVLAAVLGFVGWWGQGQLSIVTVLGVLRTVTEGGSLAFLLYDPFSLIVWAFAILGFVLWGRGLFCGWLCPFGAMQEFAFALGRRMRLPTVEPTALWDERMKLGKYVLLAGLVATVFVAPDEIDTVAEVEPFKTAITTVFLRDWPFVAYAVAILATSLLLFKGYCRYVCPLGAVMALGGLLRGRDWIARRRDCGSPCQLCRVKCAYGAIRPTGGIDYSECFQCLDCVTIHDDPNRCVPLILSAKRAARAPRKDAAE
ncbi:4Fe-4S binding protein [Mesobacterium sp. TK19101]|uniref:4Fe-4S binding protein n=1 Tax=Mesobacterium hydrothermale TaxID=3111907 RepID=A0ABU6HKR0_9RHOB|nr:4Fe-4S binding protein [Mesobacterium sp. TK19101]MEC3861740.1 4Fe-4S binding protein [Mesobacterium sp. TK19101]